MSTGPKWGAGRPVPPAELRLAQEALGLTQGQFARALGVSVRAYRYWLRVDRPTPPYVGLVLDLLWDLRAAHGLGPFTQAAYLREIARQRGGAVPWWQDKQPATNVDLQAPAPVADDTPVSPWPGDTNANTNGD